MPNRIDDLPLRVRLAITGTYFTGLGLIFAAGWYSHVHHFRLGVGLALGLETLLLVILVWQLFGERLS